MTPKEQTRVQVLNSLLAEQIALDQAAESMGVSHATPEAVIADVVHLASTRYQGANHTHLSEREGIDIGRTTLRRILLDAGLSSPRRRRPPKHRVRRQRMPREGMLIQMDGSHHPWLGDQAPPCAKATRWSCRNSTGWPGQSQMRAPSPIGFGNEA